MCVTIYIYSFVRFNFIRVDEICGKLVEQKGAKTTCWKEESDNGGSEVEVMLVQALHAQHGTDAAPETEESIEDT